MNWEELGGNRLGTGRKPGESWMNWVDLGGTGRNWVELGGNRVNLGGTWWIWVDLGGNWEGSGWNWEELSCQKMLFIFIITIRLIHVLEFSVVALFSFLCMI